MIFKFNNSVSGGQREFEPSSKVSEISSYDFQQILKFFTKGLGERKGQDRNLWVKKFIKKIDYSKEEISITLYYKVDCEKEESAIFGSGCPHPAAAKNGGAPQGKKIPSIHMDRGNHKPWLEEMDSNHHTGFQRPVSYH